jgi:phosphate transport system substrate-binding protein
MGNSMKNSMRKLAVLAFVSVLAAGAGQAGAAWAEPITVVSREDGSGTRGAFVELFGVLDKDKKDNTTDAAEIVNSTSVVVTSVVGDGNAIGYISLGSLNDTVKALRIDGAEASVANVNNGKYKISRPFIIATNSKKPLSAAAKDFIGFIMSAEGQKVIGSRGYIEVKDTGAFSGGKAAGKVAVAGSSSVTPVMESLAEAYRKLNPKADIEIQQSDSSTGMNAAIDGICDIGMASREIKDSELKKGLSGKVIAVDGIAVIVNKKNPVSDLTKEQVRGIFTGEITDWAQAAK